jgi:hypothetical protein
MESMNELQRIEYSFKAWLEKSSEKKYKELTEAEKNVLLDYHCACFISILADMTKMEHPLFTEKNTVSG